MKFVPAYSQIQTYIELQHIDNLHLSFAKYRRFMEAIGYVESGLEKWLAQFSCEVSQDYSFGGVFSWRTITSENTHFLLAAYVNGWSTEVLPQLDNPWLELALLFETQDLEVSYDPAEGFTPILYKPTVVSGLWALMQKLSRDFMESGVYLTDDFDDGKPWEAFMGGDGSIWAFDLALIPAHLSDRFANVADTHIMALFEYGIGLARRDRWQVLPWEVTPSFS